MDRRRIQSAGAPKRPPNGMASSSALPSELLASIRIDLAASGKLQNKTISPLELKQKAEQSLYLQNMKMKMKTKRRASYNPLNYANSITTGSSCLNSSGIQSKDQSLVDNKKSSSIQKRKILVVKKQINAFPPDFFAWSNDTSVIKKINSLENSEKMNKSSQGIHGIYESIIDSSFAEKPSDFTNEFMEPSSQLSTKNTSLMQAERKYIEDSNIFFGRDNNGDNINLANTGVFQVDDCLDDESRFSTEFTPRKELSNITSIYNNRKASQNTNIFLKQSSETTNWKPSSLKVKPPKPNNSSNNKTNTQKNIFKRDSDGFQGALINNYSSNHRNDAEKKNQLEMLEQKCTFGIFPVENTSNKQKYSVNYNQSTNKENGGYSISTPVQNHQQKPNNFKQSSYSVKQQQQFPTNPLNSLTKPTKNISDRFIIWNQKIPDVFKPMKSRCNSTHLHNAQHFQSCNSNSDNINIIPSKISLQTIDCINPSNNSLSQGQKNLQVKIDLPKKNSAPQGGLAKRRSYSYKQELQYQSETTIENHPQVNDDFLKNYFSEAAPSTQEGQENSQKNNETLEHTREMNNSHFSRRTTRSKRSFSHKDQSTDRNRQTNQNIYEFSFNKTASIASMNNQNLRETEDNTVTPFAVQDNVFEEEQNYQKENIPPSWGYFNHNKNHQNKENCYYQQTQELSQNKSNHSATMKLQQQNIQPHNLSSKNRPAQKPNQLLFSSKVLQKYPI